MIKKYGKRPFKETRYYNVLIKRRYVALAKASTIHALSFASANIIAQSDGPKEDKALAIAKLIINMHIATTKITNYREATK